ncbi:signal recognition particle receptor subunit alpha [Angomonas deanei]|uniref:Signal recognition particle, alpha subunit, N-terminal/SRP54-type protein, helical bundle domain/SRP54-type protein, GTPase domain containing protein, putative n=1 Tax=Angomonas deanei TaxID=59799 RepID=S9UB86_9TRYP|nr:signal recognition particle receptor subunit alpha [Angomonas deanei]EPY39718.1 signal recognition particle receptor subunit alpha [Angomonas deanei]CAD2212885.1 Signal recognition particle, alpha subunit, N-terminal/SRP54-type protein, helical bundle domain/SRP54-type protein, GTPase domain containing protein, putative [Angomonas deanei]|eukprot:EPY25999.1 signal recognition particle receptor subunit alpha [Angomonas deanei]
MDVFLREVALEFAAQFENKLANNNIFGTPFDFAKTFNQLLSKFEASEKEATGGKVTAVSDESENESTHEEEVEDGEEEEENWGKSGEAAQRSGDVIVTKSGKRIGGRGKASTTVSQGKTPAQEGKPAAQDKQRKKKPVKWEEKYNDPAVAQQTKEKPTEEELEKQVAIQRQTYIKRLPNGAIAPVEEKEWEQPRGRLANWLRSYVGNREVDEQDLKNVIPSLREKLIGKNVAVEVAEHVCKSVEASLAGKKLGTFDSLHKTVESAMITSLKRIMQPKHEVNILRDVSTAKQKRRPYSIVLCGVNGVGKSTTLAKIAYWLQQNNFSILIAAGDTFRHGAVEQLEVHGRCLDVPVFQMGYGSDPSAVAAAAISQAARQHIDVVMIDTAGRMQDHESRMRALAKLINDNQPDLTLFVGEALVGNTGVDQLRRFNQCLVDFAPVGSHCRGVDGIVLTKFDTIDDKVGAALSMVYELGQPIVFVGVGQTYQDLKVIEPDVVVSALMK